MTDRLDQRPVSEPMRRKGGEPEERSTDDLLDRAIEVFKSRTKRKLTREDGRQAIENLVGFFGVLAEWDAAEQAATSGDKPVGGEERKN